MKAPATNWDKSARAPARPHAPKNVLVWLRRRNAGEVLHGVRPSSGGDISRNRKVRQKGGDGREKTEGKERPAHGA